MTPGSGSERRSAPPRRGLALLPLLFLLLPEAVLAFGLGLHPTTVEVGLNPGGRHRQVLTVGNLHRERSLALTVGLADWTLDEHQKLELFPPGSTLRTAAPWVRFSPAVLKLKPGETRRVLVEIDVPVELEGPGDYRFAVLVSPVLPPPDKRAESPSGVWSKVQVSSLFYITLPPASAEAKVVDARMEQGDDGGPELVFSVSNTGNSHARVTGHLHLLDASGRRALTQPVNRVVLEGQTGRVRAPLHESWRQLPAGRYTVDFDLDAYEGSVPVRLAAPPTLELPFGPPPKTKEAMPKEAAPESVAPDESAQAGGALASGEVEPESGGP